MYILLYIQIPALICIQINQSHLKLHGFIWLPVYECKHLHLHSHLHSPWAKVWKRLLALKNENKNKKKENKNEENENENAIKTGGS